MQAVAQRQAGQRYHQPAQSPPAAPPKPQQRWPDHVKLLLDTQRPQVQHGLGIGGIVKIPGLTPEHEVGQKSRPACHMTTELLIFPGGQYQPAIAQADGHHQTQRRKDAPHTPRIEMAQTKLPAFKIAQYQPGDQVARDHKKNIHPNKAARQQAWKGMKKQHKQHRQGAQTIDVGAIRQGLAVLALNLNCHST